MVVGKELESMSKVHGGLHPGLGRMALLAFAALVGTMPALAEDSKAVEVPKSGYLIIAGGSLENPNRSKVFQRLKQMAGTTGTVVVLPTASGVPDEVGPELKADFDSLLGEGRGVLVNLTTRTAELADSTTVAETIASGSILFFSGGDQSRITAVFRPGGGQTAAYRATLDVLRQGGVVAGSSAGAAMQSDPMITWGSSDDALINGQSSEEDRGVGIATGMGYFPYGLTDQHFLRRGRLGRLIAAQFLTGTRFGWGVDEKRAMLVNLEKGYVEAVGEQCFLLSDIDSATSEPGKVTGVRLSLLNHGDRVDGLSGEITRAESSKPIEPGSGETMARELPVNPWSDFAIPVAMRHVLATRESVVMRSREHEVVLRAADDLAGWRGGDEDIAVGVSGVLMDIRRLAENERPAAAPAARTRR
jgi:cyanophycinase